MYLQLILTPYANEWFSFNVNTTHMYGFSFNVSTIDFNPLR